MIIPESFKLFRQFILWKPVQRVNKVDKVPVNISGHNIDPHDTSHHLTADEVLHHATTTGFGIGFTFTKHDPFFFLDIDHALKLDNTWNEIATGFCTMFQGCFIELSYSGTGLHVFGSGVYKPHGCKNKSIDCEFYTENRFVALTGTNATGDASHIYQEGIDYLIDNYFPPGIDGDVDTKWTTTPCDEWNGIEDDEQLITKFMQSRSAAAILGTRASIQDLWNGNIEALSRVFPHASKPFDHSLADAALAQHLAFWTGKNCERMYNLICRSGLNRDKWKRKNYREPTILKACSICKKVYGERREQQQNPETPFREGFQYLTLDRQVELFRGCAYVRDLHRAFTPDGALLKPDQFRAMYGGYVFAVDTINDRTTRSAWEAFTENQGISFNRVHNICFRPELPSGTIIEEENRLLINTYVPITTERIPGDVTPFLNHLQLMLPDENDQQILLAYMAAIIQYPGSKFQWCPLMQGCEGNGKTFFINCIAHAVGHRYTHLPNASDLGGNGSKFNSWIQNKLFIGVEEIYVSDRREVADALKPLITNPRIEIQGKGVDQYTGDNRANFFMCSNHKDGVYKHKNDRRYCVFFTAQQDTQDMQAAGMYRNGYFPKLYLWAKSGGYAHIAYYLQQYQIPEQYNPATSCDRAPFTSSTQEALSVSMGGIEQEILEAVSENRAGFSGGWISSMAFNKFLEQRRDTKRITPIKRKEILHNLGYVYHPALPAGRVNSVIPGDGGKPRLYVHRDHLYMNLKTQQEVVEAYIRCQPWGTPANPINHTGT
jgi:hypothetical protein